MATMVCGNCGRYGIEWHALTGLCPYTECPHCGGRNCQRLPEPIQEQEQEQDEDDEDDDEVQP